MMRYSKILFQVSIILIIINQEPVQAQTEKDIYSVRIISVDNLSIDSKNQTLNHNSQKLLDSTLRNVSFENLDVIKISVFFDKNLFANSPPSSMGFISYLEKYFSYRIPCNFNLKSLSLDNITVKNIRQDNLSLEFLCYYKTNPIEEKFSNPLREMFSDYLNPGFPVPYPLVVKVDSGKVNPVSYAEIYYWNQVFYHHPSIINRSEILIKSNSREEADEAKEEFRNYLFEIYRMPPGLINFQTEINPENPRGKTELLIRIKNP